MTDQSYVKLWGSNPPSPVQRLRKVLVDADKDAVIWFQGGLEEIRVTRGQIRGTQVWLIELMEGLDRKRVKKRDAATWPADVAFRVITMLREIPESAVIESDEEGSNAAEL